MLIDVSHLSAEADRRRNTLLADAENFRLARLARQALRTRRRAGRPGHCLGVEPPVVVVAVDQRRRRAPRNGGAESRYGVPR